MRKLTLLLLTVLLVMTAANIHLERVIETQRDMYARDTVLAYEAGIKHGIEQAVDSSPDVEALTTLFDKYHHADAENFARWVVYYSAKYRIPQFLIAGMLMQESSCNPDAVSRKGARGLTQVIWKWWGKLLSEYGVAKTEMDLHDPETSIEAGACILRHLLDRYGDIHEALRHYSGNARGYTDKVIGRVVG